MSAAAVAVRVPERTRPRSRLRVIPPIETFPRFVSFAQTPAGKVALVGAFGLGYGCFLPQPGEWLTVTLTLGLISFLPKWRGILVMAGTLGLAATQMPVRFFLPVAALGLILFWCARRWPQSMFGRRPVAFLLTGFALIIVATSRIPQSSPWFFPIWISVGMLTRYVWFIGYALMDRSASASRDAALEVGSFQPFWGSTTVPYAKGAAYLRRIEAKNAQELAITQLKGIKLLAWALLLLNFQHLWMFVFHTYLHIPSEAHALAMSVRRMPYPWYVCWQSQVLAFFETVLGISVFGHQVIAVCRMSGFNALRNTYRPLSSPTVMEFFNRFYFYFKELLVDFFFYPTFFRYFKRHRRLRIVAATFAAATFGNMFFHFTRDFSMIAKYGLAGSIINFQVFAFYCVVLGTALSISQLRRNTPRTGFVFGRLLPAAWVTLFYCMLDVFGSTERNYPLTEHLRFLAHMFGIDF
ncbi:MAG TPA: hypothetical protein VKT29_15710 [Terriglobales bacterium]|nr:hypothetical protein [Terriglobales bacterium]